MNITLSSLSLPLGDMLLGCDDDGVVRALEFAERRSRLHRNLREQYGAYTMTEAPAPERVATALRSYFDGELNAIDEVKVKTIGTPFQEKVWEHLRRIRPGQTLSYGDVGKACGITDWRAAVDAGSAVGANPIAIIVPCHRVLSAGGDLKGYAWGLHRKRWLLEHEGALKHVEAPASTAPLF